jgi:hypothetical protein
MRLKKSLKSSRNKDVKPHAGQWSDPNRATRNKDNLSRTLGDKRQPPADRGAAEKESEVQGSD